MKGWKNKEGLTGKSRKQEEIFTLNYSLYLYFDSSFQKYQKHHFVLLLSTTKQWQKQNKEKYISRQILLFSFQKLLYK